MLPLPVTYAAMIILAVWLGVAAFWSLLILPSISTTPLSIPRKGGVDRAGESKDDRSWFLAELPVDHFNETDKRTFQNRYWINGTFYQPGGPIFLFDLGEHGVSDSIVSLFLEESIGSSAVMALARQYHGLAILWEHRFYGQTQPFALDADSGIANEGYEAYRYLTTEQALEDTAYFARNFCPPPSAMIAGSWTDLSPENAPWVFVGGSYSGVRAALARKRNPETWYASWASSAPVQAQVDMSVYYRPMQQRMPRNCSADLHAAVAYADTVLLENDTESDKAAELRERVYALGVLASFLPFLPSSNNSPAPPHQLFASAAAELSLWTIAQILAMPFQHTSRKFQLLGFSDSLQEFCDDLEQYNVDEAGMAALPPPLHLPPSALSPATSSLPPHERREKDLLGLWKDFLNRPLRVKGPHTDAGLAASHNASTALHGLLSAIYRKTQRDDSMAGASPLGPSSFPGDRISWLWQTCTEYGYFQVSNASYLPNFISRFYNVSSTVATTCYRVFPFLRSMQTVPEVDAINRYGGWNISVSNVMFTNGQFDPWRTLGVHADQAIHPAATLSRPSTMIVPRCNEPPPGNAVFGHCYTGQVHVSDLLASVNTPILGQPHSPFDVGLGLFSSALDAWLRCFQKRSGSGPRSE